MNESEKQRLFSLFARGMEPERAVEELGKEDAGGNGISIRVEQVERLHAEYVALSRIEKLELILEAEPLSERIYRVLDDIADIKRLDTLADNADKGTLFSLLDMKRKIKQRMAKEQPRTRDAQEEKFDPEIAEYYRKICGPPPSKA